MAPAAAEGPKRLLLLTWLQQNRADDLQPLLPHLAAPESSVTYKDLNKQIAGCKVSCLNMSRGAAGEAYDCMRCSMVGVAGAAAAA